MENYKPDFKKAYTAAHEKLIALKPGTSFPLSAVTIIQTFSDIRLCSYEHAEKKGYPRSFFQSDSAELKELNGRFIIFYDETKPHSHNRFSIFHEWAHYELFHDMNVGKDKTLYDIQEAEANLFAAELQMPEPVIKELEKRGMKMNADAIQCVFGTSMQAAEIRFKNLKKYPSFLRTREETELDEYLVKYTSQKFINAVCPRTCQFDMQDEYEKQEERDRWLCEGY